MPLSNATIAEINALNYANEIFYLFWAFVLIALGTIGHSLSIYVFTRPILRSNPCACYFLSATIIGLFVTYVNTPLRLLQYIYNYDVFKYSTASCKILTWILLCARALASWFIVLASIDRLGPSVIMLIFGSLTIRHVQHSVGRVNASHIATKSENASAAPIQEKLQRQKTADRQLIRMMIAQCAYFAVLTTPISGSYMYISLTINTVLDDLQFAQVNLFTNIAGLLSTTGACTSFFVFTLSSKLFRHELKHLFTWRWH
ncbi:unnamed protein product [Adineta steineri]|uniref:G-protein coupled receptors family 1 profile domain-containing protein n=1 Tax=Adineta steineri TaxID=433720 RepID=A0A819V725_9BILA|nr:unnamed protein product [Adineta steineri]